MASKIVDPNGLWVPPIYIGDPTTVTLPAVGAMLVQGNDGILYSVAASGVITPILTSFSTAKPASIADGTIITQFQTGHGWVTAYGAGSPPGTTNLNDTTDHYVGTQCASLTSNGQGAVQGVKHLALPSMDFTGKMLKFSVKLVNSANLATSNAGFLIYLGDTNIANYYVFTPWNAQPQQAMADGIWYNITLPWFADPALYGAVGTPNRAAITDICFRLKDSGTAGVPVTPVTAYIGQVSIASESAVYPNGVISFRFDDNHASTYSIVRPIFQPNNWQATCPVIVSAVGGLNCMTLAQMKELELLYWDFCLHAYSTTVHNVANGYTGSSALVVNNDMEMGIAWLKANGFSGFRHLAYPQGFFALAAGTNVLALASQKFLAASTISNATLESHPPCDPLRLRAYNVTYPTSTLAGVKLIVDRAVAAKVWLQLVFHEITTTPSVDNQWATADFQALCNYIVATYPTTPVKTIASVLSI